MKKLLFISFLICLVQMSFADSNIKVFDKIETSSNVEVSKPDSFLGFIETPQSFYQTVSVHGSSGIPYLCIKYTMKGVTESVKDNSDIYITNFVQTIDSGTYLESKYLTNHEFILVDYNNKLTENYSIKRTYLLKFLYSLQKTNSKYYKNSGLKSIVQAYPIIT